MWFVSHSAPLSLSESGGAFARIIYTFTLISSCRVHTVGVVLSAAEKLNQTIDGQTTLRVENKTLL